MPAISSAHFAAALCLALALVLALAHWRQWRGAVAPLKLAASAAFLAVAWLAGATGTPYGRLVLAALVLSAIGDALLLSKQSRMFLAGLGAFLLAHAVYALAFARHGLDPAWLAIGAILMTINLSAVMVWLLPRLHAMYRYAVPAYMLAIGVMVATALGTGAASGRWLIPAGALAFALSDIAVARERFIAPGPINKAWGLPLYYLGQVLLALSVAY
jgi:uncharacterized membrane protein YhhN